MSVKTCRILQIIAFSLFVLALLLTIVSVFCQTFIKSIYTTAPEILSQFNLPWGAFFRCLLYVILGLVSMILVLIPMSSGGSRAVTIIMAIVTGVHMGLILPALDMLINTLAGQEGMIEFSAYNYLNSAVSLVVSFLTVPALILMLVGLGGFFGKDSRFSDLAA